MAPRGAGTNWFSGGRVAPYNDPEFEFASNLADADWIVDGLADPRRSGYSVGCIVPAGFPAYARILHPAFRRVENREEPVPWSSVAELSGTIFGPDAAFEELLGPLELVEGSPSPEGSGLSLPLSELDPDASATLARLLEPFTSEGRGIYYAVWDGYGLLHPLPSPAVVPRLRIPRTNPLRSYLVFRAPLSALMSWAGTAFLCPNLWWPQDREWCVAGDTDLVSTFVGGSHDCIRSLLGSEDLESVPIRRESKAR